MMNKEEVAKLAEPDPELTAFLDGVDLPVFDWYDLQPFRAFRAEMMRNNLAVWGPPPQEVSESYEKIELRDGYQSSLKLFKPTKHPTGGSPLIVLIHGGGFVMGSPEQLIPYGRALCKIFGATVVALSYRLAPEYKFPTQINDGWDTVQWCASNAESKLGADPSAGFIVGGVSAGGNLSAVIAQNSLEQKLAHPLTGIWLSVPVIFPAKEWVPEKYHDVYFSHEQNKDAPLLDAKAVKAVEDHLQPDNHSKWFSPYNAKNPHTGLPKTLIQVDGLDPLRDDGLVHEHVLKEHGVETRLDIWPGVPHAHFSALPMLKIGKKAMIDTFIGFGWLLNKNVSPEQVREALAAPGDR